MAMGDLGERFMAQVIGDSETGDAERAIELVGGRTLARIPWAEVHDRLDRYGGRSVLSVEAEGVDDALLIDALPRIEAVASAMKLPVVVSLDETQIDVVTAAGLLGDSVQLLCTPTIAERVAAQSIAASMLDRGPLTSSVSEGEAARLARMNAEVGRIAELLTQLIRDEPVMPRATGLAADRARSFEGAPVELDEMDAQHVRQAIRARRLRDQFIAPGLFEDPAWDMTLDLFAAHLEGRRVSVSSLCIASAVAPTTALRWIGKLTDAGLFERQRDAYDRRRAFMALSADTIGGMRSYVGALRQQGLPIV